MTAIDSGKYQIVNGTHYDARTPAEIVRVLEQARLHRTRIHLHFGDTESSGDPVSRPAKDLGLDWLEEWDCRGGIGRSMGPIKIPLLIANSRSIGGPGILDHCIVRIRAGNNGRDLYRHANYHHGEIVLKAETFVPPVSSADSRSYEAAAYVNGLIHARFKSMEQARRWVNKLGLVVGI